MAVVRVAEATTVLRDVDISSPVLGSWAHEWGAHALALFDVPVQALVAGLRNADTLALFDVEKRTFFAGCNWGGTLAKAFFDVEIIIIILDDFTLQDVTVAFASVVVPVGAFFTMDGGALTCTANCVPVEVVRALSWAADARTDGLVENFIILALLRTALALAHVSIDVLIGSAGFNLHTVVTFTAAAASVPEEVSRAVVGRLGFLAEATADARVEVVRRCAIVR